MRGVRLIRARAKAGVMACAIIGMSFMLAPGRSDRDMAVAPSLVWKGVSVVGKTSPLAAYDREAIQIAVATFVWGLSSGKPATVHHVAPDKDQAEFGVEDAATASVASACAALANAKTLTFDDIRIEHGTAVVRAYVDGDMGQQWQTLFTLSRESAGAWGIVDCRIDLAPAI
jgi:hypothetical protein